MACLSPDIIHVENIKNEQIKVAAPTIKNHLIDN
jgi:hypothetical protein